MPDPKAPDDNPLKKEIDKVSSAGRNVLRMSGPNQLAAGAKNLRSMAKKKLGF